MKQNHGSRLRGLVLALGVAIPVGWAGSAAAVTNISSTWAGGATGNWGNAASWNPAVVPNDNGTNAYLVRVDDSPTAAGVTIDGTYTIDRLQIDAGDGVNIADARTLQVTAANGAGVIQNAGTLQVNAAGNQTVLSLQGGPITLQGGGTLLLSNSANNWLYRNDAYGALVNVDNTIRGAGNIGWFATAMPITNGGTIIADQSTPLQVNSTSGGTTNTGTLRAELGGTLRLTGGAIANAGGTVEALNGSVVELGNSAALTGGTLRSEGTGVIRVTGTSGTSLTNCANQGNVELPDGKAALLGAGTIQNTGRITVSGAGSSTVLYASGGPVTLTGGGEIALSNSANNWIYRVDAFGALINQDNIIHGAGNIGWFGTSMPIANAGRIIADQTAPLLVAAAGGVVNTGTFRADLGGTMQLGNGTFTNNGGIIEALNGSVVELGYGLALAGGTIRTVGTGLVRVTGTSGTSLSNLANQGQIDIMDGRSLILSQGTIQNNGRIELAGGGTQTSMYLAGGAVTLAGGGEIALSNSPNNWLLRTDGVGTLVNQDNTIHGAGNIGWYATAMPITNAGTIIADQSNQLAIDSGSAAFINTGTVRAAPGAVLLCNRTPANFSGSTLTGGTWEAAGGTLRLTGVNVTTNAANIRLNGATAAIYNAATGTTSSLAGFSKNAGGGSFRLENGASFASPAAFSDSGDVTIDTGSSFTATGPYTKLSGHAVVNGTLNAPNGLSNQLGVLAGSGTVVGNVVNACTTAPGAAVGTLTINGNYTQSNTYGRLSIEIGGTATGQFDVLQVSGQASLDGGLELKAVQGFQVQPGDTFRILNCSSLSGVFSWVFGSCLAPGVCFDVLYDGTGVTLQAFAIPPAGVDGGDGLPRELRLTVSSAVGGDQALHLAMPRDARVALTIYDLAGRRVALLRDGLEAAGTHTYRWGGAADDGRRVGSGVYFARAEVDEGNRATVRTTRLVVVR